MFRAFSQLDNSNKRNYGGTGLGLAICEKVSPQPINLTKARGINGGKIWVESEVGKGTKFHFTMLLNSAEESPPESPLPNFVRNVPAKSRQCLVIEHSSIVRDLISRDIGLIGLQGDTVTNFAEAQSCLQLNRYAVIIVDGSLSGSDTFVKEVARTAPTTRVIVTAVLGTVADLDGDNVVTTLIKPIRRWRLFKALEKALSRLPLTIKDADFMTPKEIHGQALANLAFRHPLRILVLSYTFGY